MKDLVNKQSEYIDFLSKEFSKLSWMMIVRPYLKSSEDAIKKGEKLREEINKLKEEYGIDN